MIIYWCIWALSAFNCILQKRISKFWVFIFLFFLALLVGFRGSEVDKDYPQYLKYIEIIESGGFFSIGKTYAGYFFDFISYVALNLGWTGFVFMFYAGTSIYLKTKLFYMKGNDFSSYILIYCGLFLYLHEFTQIRVGLAIAFAYLAIYYLCIDDKKKSFLCFAVSVFIHPSALVLGVFYILRKERFNGLIWFFLLCVSMLAAYFDALHYVILSVAQIFNISIINLYIDILNDGAQNDINVYGIFPLLNAVLAGICCFYFHEKKIDSFNNFSIKSYLLSSISWFLLSPIPVLAGRTSQVFLFAAVFCIPLLGRAISKKYGMLLTFTYSLLSFIAFLYVGSLLNDYQYQ
ncbi:putative membrane protein [Collimonas fungivorans]|uniref:Putative membrane protein n=1 Tax=Collimonas fungivorans TaxID=158899 RepID=A0A127P8P9_9BURK|nr:EpsG family protein [Collimonas fungivorans]AMO93791.1 putative membrane protein [Collimonas fungivorans]